MIVVEVVSAAKAYVEVVIQYMHSAAGSAKQTMNSGILRRPAVDGSFEIILAMAKYGVSCHMSYVFYLLR